MANAWCDSAESPLTPITMAPSLDEILIGVAERARLFGADRGFVLRVEKEDHDVPPSELSRRHLLARLAGQRNLRNRVSDTDSRHGITPPTPDPCPLRKPLQIGVQVDPFAADDFADVVAGAEEGGDDVRVPLLARALRGR